MWTSYVKIKNKEAYIDIIFLFYTNSHFSFIRNITFCLQGHKIYMNTHNKLIKVMIHLRFVVIN